MQFVSLAFFCSHFLFFLRRKVKTKNCYFCSFLSCIWWLPATKKKKKTIKKRIQRTSILLWPRYYATNSGSLNCKNTRGNKVTKQVQQERIISRTSSSGFIAFVLFSSFFFFFFLFCFYFVSCMCESYVYKCLAS